MKFTVKFANDRTLEVDADRSVPKADEGLLYFLVDDGKQPLIAAVVSIRNMLFYKSE